MRYLDANDIVTRQFLQKEIENPEMIGFLDAFLRADEANLRSSQYANIT